jgi:hypothetical protein
MNKITFFKNAIFTMVLFFSITLSAQIEPGTIMSNDSKSLKTSKSTTASKSTNNLSPLYSVTGQYFLSADGVGSTSSSMSVQINKPSTGATVHKAFLFSVTVPYGSAVTNGCVSINGSAVNWDGNIIKPTADYNNHWADVTSLVSSSIDGMPAGLSTLPITECNGDIDGNVLLVIFNENIGDDETVAILWGAQNSAGDNFNISLNDPIDPTDPESVLDMGIAISYGYQGSGQYSIIDINGTRLTTSAGGQDDGAAANGALITVGGIGDSNANPPDPNALATNTRSDDELYSLLPFIDNTTTSLTAFTQNPSNNDNIFLAYFVISGSASVATVCPEAVTVNNESGTCGATVNYVVTEGSLQTVGLPSGSVFPIGTTTNTFTNPECSFEVTVIDSEAPVTPVLADVTGECTATATAPTTTDNCAGIITGTTSNPLTYSAQGTHVITWTFDDGNGNVITANQNVIVNDTTDPNTPTLADVTGQCDATATAPTTTDNCAGIITGTTSNPLTYSAQGTHVITWTFDDGNGNVITANQNVIVNDTTDPNTPTLADVTGQCDATATVPTTTDDCAGTINGTTSNATTYNTQGTYVITWSFDDGNGNVITANQNVIVNDTTDPNTPTLADVTGQCDATAAVPTTTDNCAGTINGTTSNPTTYDTQGTHVITWSFDDGNGNVITANQNVIVNDTTDPNTPTLADVTGQCDATATVPTTTDNCAGTINGTTSNPTTYDTQGTHVITWSFDDGNGNVITANQNVIVNDTTDPNTPTLADVTGQCDATAAVPTTTDNCAGTINGTTSNPTTYDTQGTHVITWSFDDGNGNVITANQNVIVNDTTDPNAPTLSDVTGQCDATAAVPTTTDNCVDTINGTTSNPLTYSAQGTHVITWTFDDGNGNVITANQNVIVNDTTDPNMPTLADVTGQCDATAAVPTTTDICAGTINGTTSNPTTYDTQGTHVITWTFDDGNGNVITANQNVIVNDTTDPNTPTLADVTGQCDATAAVPTTTDNCVGIITGTTSDLLTYSAQGTHVITWTFDDGNGNVITANQNVIVNDTTAPIAVAQDITVTLDEFGSATITADDIDNGSSDNCTFTLSIDVTTFDCTNIDINNTVTLTVTDAAGNTDTTTANVTILEHFKDTLDLRSLGSFEAFTGTGAITNAGAITGDVGTNAGALTGFTSTSFIGNVYFNDALTAQADIDLMKVYIHLNNIFETYPGTHAPAFGSGELITPGVYSIGGAGSVAGTLTLDGQGDPNAVFILKFKGAFTAGAATNINLINGADAANIYWVAQGAISIGANSTIKGTLLAYPGAITLGVNSSIEGRLLSSVGAITVAAGGTAIMPAGIMNIPINPMVSYTPAAAVDVLGSIENFSLFTSNGAVANASTSGIIGDVGADIGAITGFATSPIIGSYYNADAVTAQAKIDLNNAYTQLMLIPNTVSSHTPAFGSGETLLAGVYTTAGAGSLAGTITLDGAGDPDAIFIFKFNAAFAAGAQSRVILSNGTRRCNVFWISEGATSIGSFSTIKGTVIANNAAATMGAGGNLEGRLLSTGGAIGFSTSVVYTVVHDVECSNITAPKTAVKTAADTAITSFEEELQVYPNPSKGIFNIKLAIFNVDTEIYLFDTTGKLIARKSISKENNSGNMIAIGNNNLSSGIYLVKIITKNETVTKKVIVEKSH